MKQINNLTLQEAVLLTNSRQVKKMIKEEIYIDKVCKAIQNQKQNVYSFYIKKINTETENRNSNNCSKNMNTLTGLSGSERISENSTSDTISCKNLIPSTKTTITENEGC